MLAAALAATSAQTLPRKVCTENSPLNLGIRNGVGKRGRGNQPPYRRYGPDTEIQYRPWEPHGLAKTQQNSLQKGSRYGISVSTPHRRYGHRLRTPFLRTPFPRLLFYTPLTPRRVFSGVGDACYKFGERARTCWSLAWAQKWRVPTLVPARQDMEQFLLHDIKTGHGLCILFGGTAAQKTVMHKLAVEYSKTEPRLKWVHAQDAETISAI